VNEHPLTITPPGDAFLVERASAIRALGKRVARDIVEIGRLLAKCKKHVGHDGWPQWLKREFEWSDDSALRFMRVRELVNSRNLRDLSLPVSALYLLARPSTVDDIRDEVIERAVNGEAIARHAKAAALKARAP
jgi:Protein of unknown function (DUF3102)